MLPLTSHAKFEMERRGIKEEEIEQVFLNPVQKIKLSGVREIWQNQMTQDGKIYVLRMVVELEPKLTIVTVYKSSKIKKYWREDS